MPKVEHRKAYPEAGIEPGKLYYYYVSMKTGPRSSKVMRSKTPFKRWQLTMSEYYAKLWQIEDALSEFDGGFEEMEDLKNQL